MTNSEVTADDISQALQVGICGRCETDWVDQCRGCLVMSAYRQADWLETQRKVTAKERVDK